MAAFKAAADLVTFLRANITMANVAALSTRPLIQLQGVPDSGGAAASGKFEIIKEDLRTTRLTDKYRDETYFITAEFSFAGTSETTFKELIEEIDLTLMTENLTIDRAYLITLDWIWDTNVIISVAYYRIEMVKQSVSVTA
ncbi:MAG: hypothetical protein IH840_00060 [Candidatus Heimdallarchaeota archaeon]|nr:hypothetical protein [Candidatus Heimdallarchaeota archaeon]